MNFVDETDFEGSIVPTSRENSAIGYCKHCGLQEYPVVGMHDGLEKRWLLL